MTSFGYTLSSEEHGPSALVTNARRAEELGFDFVSISDHYHPWVTDQGHSPFVWSVLGAIAATTEHIDVGVGVTCPILRIHPAILAQAAATTSLLFDGRFFFGVGTGEALNEHFVGRRWPRPEIRREMLEEAVAVIRQLWTGETIDHRGGYYEVENARVFDPPDAPVNRSSCQASDQRPPSLPAGSATAIGATHPTVKLLDAFERGRRHGPALRAAQPVLGRRRGHRQEDGAQVLAERGGQQAALAGSTRRGRHFEQAAEPLTEEQVTKSVPCGPDITDEFVKSVRPYVDAGYDHLYFHHIGPDQAGFFRFWEAELRFALANGS